MSNTATEVELPTESNNYDAEVSHLKKLVEVAQHDKLAAEAQFDQSRKQLEVKVVHLEKNIITLQNEILDIQKQLKEKDIENDRLSTKLEQKESLSTEREEMLKVRAEEAEKLLICFKDDFDKSGKPMTANEKFDIMELRGQLVVQRKKVQALEMNVKGAELELAAKVKVDTKKTELIALLDKKMTQQKSQIEYLLTTAETLVQEKETQAKKLSHVCDELKKLSERYVDNEKITNDLRRNNNQLKKMLNSLDGKGQQIIGLAKEKVKSYSDKNKKLQEEVDCLKSELSTDSESLATTIKTIEDNLSISCAEILQKINILSEKDALGKEDKDMLHQIQNRIVIIEKGKKDLSEASKTTEKLEPVVDDLNLVKTEEQKEEKTASAMGDENVSLKEIIKSKDKELEQLRSELGAIRALVLGAAKPAE